MSLLPTPSDSPAAWTPPQAKTMRWIINGLLIVFASLVAAYIINKFGITWITAVDTLTNLVGNLTTLAWTTGILAVSLWLLYETFSSNGKINKLFSLQYSSMINRMTWAVMVVDPLSPFLERQKEVQLTKQKLMNASARFDGVITGLGEKSQAYAKEAAKHERTARGAQAELANNPRLRATFQIESEAFSRCKEMATELDDMRQRLIPYQQRAYALVDATEVLDKNLDLEIRIARDKWDTSMALEDVTKASRTLFAGSEKAALAAKAQQIIDAKYGMQLGALDNVTRLTQPMLDAIDIERGTASQELLDKWQQEATPLLALTGPNSTPEPVATDQSATFRDLVK